VQFFSVRDCKNFLYFFLLISFLILYLILKSDRIYLSKSLAPLDRKSCILIINMKSNREKITHLKIKAPIYFIQIFSKTKNEKSEQNNSKLKKKFTIFKNCKIRCKLSIWQFENYLNYAKKFMLIVLNSYQFISTRKC